MAVKALRWKEARQALQASGLGVGSLLGLLWPFGRDQRARALLRERRAVLEAKSAVVDYLFRAQRVLAPFRLTNMEQLQKALQNPDKRQLIASVGINRGMMEEALHSRYHADAGRPLDRALAELLVAGVVLKVAPLSGLSQEIYVAAQGRPRPAFDLSALTRLLQEGRDYGSQLRERYRRQEATDRGRTHRI